MFDYSRVCFLAVFGTFFKVSPGEGEARFEQSLQASGFDLLTRSFNFELFELVSSHRLFLRKLVFI
jgi:hypothetical protein